MTPSHRKSSSKLQQKHVSLSLNSPKSTLIISHDNHLLAPLFAPNPTQPPPHPSNPPLAITTRMTPRHARIKGQHPLPLRSLSARFRKKRRSRFRPSDQEERIRRETRPRKAVISAAEKLHAGRPGSAGRLNSVGPGQRGEGGKVRPARFIEAEVGRGFQTRRPGPDKDGAAERA